MEAEDFGRPRGDGESQQEEMRVTSLELFFDLVFVFTLTQLTGLLVHDLSLASVGQVVVIFVVLFWMYGGYVWLTNQVPPVTTARRLLLICGMCGFLTCALAIPRAFGVDGLAFGVGYVFVVLVHAGLYAEAYGRAVLSFGPVNLLGAGSVLAAGLVGDPARAALWLVPIALQVIAARLTRRVNPEQQSGFDLRPAHFVERHGLLLIVAFGESVVAIGTGIHADRLDVATVGAAVLGLLLAAALWWTYFADDERLGESTLVDATFEGRVTMALNAFFYAFIVILLGVVTLAAGVRLTIGDLGARLADGPALLLGGGAAIYLVGDVLFRLALHIRPITVRLGGAAVAAATLLVGVNVSALAQLVFLVATLLAVLWVERRSDALGPVSRVAAPPTVR